MQGKKKREIPLALYISICSMVNYQIDILKDRDKVN